MRRRIALLLLPVLFAVGGVAACADATPTGRVTVIASWSEAPADDGGTPPDTEAAAFVAVLDEFERRTGITVDYRGTRDVSQVLRSGVDRGSPPDVAVLPRLNDLQTYVPSRKLHPLDDVLGGERRTDLEPQLVTLGGRVYGLSVNVIPKSLVWYAPDRHPTLARRPPATWEELVAFSAGRRTPWCLGMGAPPLSGWPGTDWIEDLFLHRWGAATYQAWTAGDLPWDSPQMREVWQAWGEVTRAGRSTPNALLTGFNVAGLGMFAERPECHLDHQGSYIVRDYRRQAPDRFDFFPFPPFAARGGTATTTEIAEDVVGMFQDTPEARELIRFLAGERARQVWREASGGLSFTLNRGTDPASYPDAVSRRIAGTLARGTLCRDASDLMPAAMTAAFHRAVLHHLDDPRDLATLLRELDTVRDRIPDEEWLDLPCLSR
ncbi:ABC transporter substrate-binding protein [Micromonospora sagamiensis]|uniref:Alpha-glucoside transport system substrate-binding protein n=1 Tax=Micromonospora sagamiensis TaxID=47875 RepID=A0A562WLU6_9ACTN|nr:ABC transporter substrate-binding protein [Micromonospora sagamiensis]TWJ31021.1 alpha-glucoside transport system substrate-binding protein [Micromonospora sagamiensis]BCL15937.1 ABC transporter substrate-binding protein [Micromonospora sagamiensis]